MRSSPSVWRRSVESAASVGIVGIAVGFGAQTLVRDIFSGIFFLVDDAFRVGEYIELDSDLRSEVESI